MLRDEFTRHLMASINVTTVSPEPVDHVEHAAGIKFHAIPILLRDLGGYKISIHCDSPRKAITTQYYLPADESQLHLGTTFHMQDECGFTKVRTLRFAPNTGYAFPVTDQSW